MKLAALMLVKDEADIVGYTIPNLLRQGIDRVYVTDNLSTDGTPDVLRDLQRDFGSVRLRIGLDEEIGYFQSAKTTQLALRALADGYDWALPCDADEWWYSAFGTVKSVIERHDRERYDVLLGQLWDHIPSGEDDPDEPNPVKRIGWRFGYPGRLAKVAVRLRPDVEIGMGNHSASYREIDGRVRHDPALTLRHFTWRSEEQYVRKIRNGYLAYAHTDLDPSVGTHWRMFGPPDEETWEERVRWHYRTWFFAAHPPTTPDGRPPELVYDPAP